MVAGQNGHYGTIALWNVAQEIKHAQGPAQILHQNTMEKIVVMRTLKHNLAIKILAPLVLYKIMKYIKGLIKIPFFHERFNFHWNLLIEY